MFLTRLLSGIVLLIIITLMNIFGGAFMEFMLIFISVVGLREFYLALGISSKDKKKNILEFTAMAGIVIYYWIAYVCYMKNMELAYMEKELAGPMISMDALVPVIIFVFLAMMAEYVFCFPQMEGKTVANAFFGFIYVPVMLSFIFLTRAMSHGQYLVWLIYIVSWVCDTSAYCVGMLIGKHRLAPVLSPKKSIEGAIGGVAGSVIVSCIFAEILVKKTLIPDDMVWLFVLIGALGSIVSQIGDLAASAFKRNYEIKDYGNLIPGHGGILDRFDSVIFAAPMIYLLAQLLGRFLGRG